MQTPKTEARPDLLELVVTIAIRLSFRVAAIFVLALFFDIFENILHHQSSDISFINIAGGLAGATIGDILWITCLQQLGGFKKLAVLVIGLGFLIWIGSFFQQLPHQVQQQANISPSWMILLFAGLLVANVFSDIVWNEGARALIMPRIHDFFKKPD